MIMGNANKLTYIIYCIDKFGMKFNLSSKQAYSYLKRYKGIDFIQDNYEAEHLLSFDDAVDDLTTICKRNGGGLS